MELIVISDSKLKIMLTDEDLLAYSLDCNSLDYENTETRRAFWSILDEAKHRTGFDAASEKVFVQVYPSKGGGCEMFVTKLGMFKEAKELYENEDGDIRLAEGRDMRRTLMTDPEDTASLHKNHTKKPVAYRFEKMSELLSACKRLCESGYKGESDAYTGEKGCFLILQSDNCSAYCIDKRRVVAEYAEEIDPSFFELYIGEHGSPICRGSAVEVLSEL